MPKGAWGCDSQSCQHSSWDPISMWHQTSNWGSTPASLPTDGNPCTSQSQMTHMGSFQAFQYFRCHIIHFPPIAFFPRLSGKSHEKGNLNSHKMRGLLVSSSWETDDSFQFSRGFPIVGGVPSESTPSFLKRKKKKQNTTALALHIDPSEMAWLWASVNTNGGCLSFGGASPWFRAMQDSAKALSFYQEYMSSFSRQPGFLLWALDETARDLKTQEERESSPSLPKREGKRSRTPPGIPARVAGLGFRSLHLT